MQTYIRQVPGSKIFIILFIVLGILEVYSFVRKNEPTFYMIGYVPTTFYCIFLIGIYFSPAVISKSIDSISPWLTLRTVPFKILKNLGFISIIGHIVLAMPIPTLIYIILRTSVRKISIISILAGIFIELIQLLINLITGLSNYMVDIDGFMLQVAGTLVGLFIITLVERYHMLDWFKGRTIFIFREGVHSYALFLFAYKCRYHFELF